MNVFFIFIKRSTFPTTRFRFWNLLNKNRFVVTSREQPYPRKICAPRAYVRRTSIVGWKLKLMWVVFSAPGRRARARFSTNATPALGKTPLTVRNDYIAMKISRSTRNGQQGRTEGESWGWSDTPSPSEILNFQSVILGITINYTKV